MNKEILLKYLNSQCSDKEFEELANWVSRNAHYNDGKSWGFDQWKIFEPEPLKMQDEEKFSALLDKIHHEINLKKGEKEERQVFALSNITKWLSRVAAVLFIPLLGVMFYLLSNNNLQLDTVSGRNVDSLEVIAPIGSRTVVQLSDGSEVSLNYGSRIKYPRTFTGNTREITLDGEGYFDVAHDPDKPFVVKTGSLNVTALGTEFNVQSYRDDNLISATLVEGKVVIDKILPNEEFERIGAMQPGQHVAYNIASERIISSQGNIEQYIAWREGKMVFDNTPITTVAGELSRKFNVDIEVASDIKDLTYTVIFIEDPLYLILDLMTEITPVKYHKLPRKKQADGTYSKQIIKIEKRN